jgi:plastocyanin
MYRKKLRMLGLLLAVFALGSIVLAACVRPGAVTSGGGGTTPTATSSSGGGSNCATGTVHTLATSFQQPCVNVAKGSKLTIAPAVPSFHNFLNGTYVNGNPHPAIEPGAPKVSNVQETSSPVTIGPFNTAGTFHIYCSVHPNMDLTINVK